MENPPLAGLALRGSSRNGLTPHPSLLKIPISAREVSLKSFIINDLNDTAHVLIGKQKPRKGLDFRAKTTLFRPVLSENRGLMNRPRLSSGLSPVA